MCFLICIYCISCKLYMMRLVVALIYRGVNTCCEYSNETQREREKQNFTRYRSVNYDRTIKACGNAQRPISPHPLPNAARGPLPHPP